MQTNMKQYYLSQNIFSKEYSLDEHIFGENRINLDKDFNCDNIKKVKDILDFKRKAIFYLVEPFDNKNNQYNLLESCLRALFTGSKIKIEKVMKSE
jgi:hypothetical protein